MQKLVRLFESHPIKIAYQDDTILFAAHDVAESLKFENPRREVMLLNVASNHHKTVMISWSPNGKEFLVDFGFIIELTLRAQTTVSIRFVKWMIEIIMEFVKVSQTHPVNELTHAIPVGERTYAITQISKKYGMTGKMLNDFLHLHKIQYKVNEQWLLFAEYQNLGYTMTKTVPKRNSEGNAYHTYWTEKGINFIESLLRQHGIREVPFLNEQQMNLFEGENQ